MNEFALKIENLYN